MRQISCSLAKEALEPRALRLAQRLALRQARGLALRLAQRLALRLAQRLALRLAQRLALRQARGRSWRRAWPAVLVGPAKNGHTRKFEAFARADDVETM
jgi:hypothetical protein